MRFIHYEHKPIVLMHTKLNKSSVNYMHDYAETIIRRNISVPS